VIGRIAVLAASIGLSPLFAQSIRIPGTAVDESATSRGEEKAPAARKERTQTKRSVEPAQRAEPAQPPQFDQAVEESPRKSEKAERSEAPPKSRKTEKSLIPDRKEKPSRPEKSAAAMPHPPIPLTPFIPSNP